jgi:hypothetical protein
MERRWSVSYNGKTCEPLLLNAKEQQDTPTLAFSFDDKAFTVEFKNRSDYMASRHGTLANVIIVSANRTKRVTGTAINCKLYQSNEN